MHAPQRPASTATEALRAAISAHRQGRIDEAERHYTETLRLEPRHPEALRLLGILLRDRGDVEPALRLLRRAVECSPDDADVAAELGLGYLAAGYLLLAEQAFRRGLAVDPHSLKALANLGAVLQYRGHLAEAVDCHRRALELAPGDLELVGNLANTLAEAGRGDEALAELDRVAMNCGPQPFLLGTRGAVLCALERYAEAVQPLEQALVASPHDDMALINLGMARRATGGDEAARPVLEQAVRLNPDNARATADFVNALAGGGDAERAIALARDFLARHPGERLVVAALAYALGDAGHNERAAVLLDRERLLRVVDLPRAPGGFAGLPDFNAALAATVRRAPSLHRNPLGKSTLGGAQTGELDPAGGPALAVLAKVLDREFSVLLRDLDASGLSPEHPALGPRRPHRTLRLWGTVLPAGGRQVPHIHPLAWYSGVYYAELPPGVAGTAGALEFFRPPDRWTVHRPPAPLCVEPRPGRLVLFPSWYFHSTAIFEGGGERISLAFDFVPDLTKT